MLPILVLAGDARAETSVEVSLEWMVAKSDLVVRARFLRRAEIDGRVAGFSIWTYRVEETLLGEPRKKVDGLLRDFDEDEVGDKDAEYLLFFSKHGHRFNDPVLQVAAGKTPLALRGWIRLDAPFREYTMACDVLTQRAPLIAHVRSAAKHTRNAVVRPAMRWLEVPSLAPCNRPGSVNFMSVPTDDRLVRLAQAWSVDETGDGRRRSAAECLQTVLARAQAIERIAGIPAGEESDSLADRLARAEAGIAALRESIRRAHEACKKSDLHKALYRFRGAMLSPRTEARTALIEIFRHDLETIATAARETLWPVEIEGGNESTGRFLELCERTNERVAINVIRLRARPTGAVWSLTSIEERLYCFTNEATGGDAIHVDLTVHSFRNDTFAGRTDPVKRLAFGASVLAGLKLESKHVPRETMKSWSAWSPAHWRSHSPRWIAPFLFDEFLQAFPPLERS